MRTGISMLLGRSLLPIMFGCLSSNALAAGQPLSVRSSLSFYTFGTYTEPVKDSSLNPKNKILGIPSTQVSMDLRPKLK